MSFHPSICYKNSAKMCEINENQCHLVTERKATKDLYMYLIIDMHDTLTDRILHFTIDFHT